MRPRGTAPAESARCLPYLSWFADSFRRKRGWCNDESVSIGRDDDWYAGGARFGAPPCRVARRDGDASTSDEKFIRVYMRRRLPARTGAVALARGAQRVWRTRTRVRLLAH